LSLAAALYGGEGLDAAGHPKGAARVTPVMAGGLRVLLLDRFVLATEIAPVRLTATSQRLLAFVALAGGAVRRDLAAGILWPSVGERQAHVGLRAALARLGTHARRVVSADRLEISLVEGVSVDLDEARVLAGRLLTGAMASEPDEAAAAVAPLSVELLPGWYEEWVLLEAEEWRQLRLHALEAAAGVLAGAGRFGEAVGAAQAAVSADPLRESPHRALIGVHLSEGNQSEAVRAFEHYRQTLFGALGLEPTQRMRELLPALWRSSSGLGGGGLGPAAASKSA
jgi:SARP family transcriptional regulator, regulator of embCAB operon